MGIFMNTKILINKIIWQLRYLKYSYLFRLFKGHTNAVSIFSRKYIKSGDIVLDIGANNGMTALLYSGLVGKKGFVYSFEPNGEMRPHYKKIELENKFRNIKFYDFGLGNCNQNQKFYIDERDGAQASSFDMMNINQERKLHGENFYKEEMAEIKTLDDLKFKRVDFIKIDVEGYELEVLKGGIKTIENNRPIILFEVFINDSDKSLLERKKQFISYFNKINYHMKIVHIFAPMGRWTDSPDCYNIYNESFDCYTGCDVIAIPLGKINNGQSK